MEQILIEFCSTLPLLNCFACFVGILSLIFALDAINDRFDTTPTLIFDKKRLSFNAFEQHGVPWQFSGFCISGFAVVIKPAFSYQH